MTIFVLAVLVLFMIVAVAVPFATIIITNNEDAAMGASVASFVAFLLLLFSFMYVWSVSV